jgi:hypothetical protein
VSAFQIAIALGIALFWMLAIGWLVSRSRRCNPKQEKSE